MKDLIQVLTPDFDISSHFHVYAIECLSHVLSRVLWTSANVPIFKPWHGQMNPRNSALFVSTLMNILVVNNCVGQDNLETLVFDFRTGWFWTTYSMLSIFHEHLKSQIESLSAYPFSFGWNDGDISQKLDLNVFPCRWLVYVTNICLWSVSCMLS